VAEQAVPLVPAGRQGVAVVTRTPVPALLRDLDRQRSARLAALERFADAVGSALTTPGLDEAQRLAHIHTAYSHLVWSRP